MKKIRVFWSKLDKYGKGDFTNEKFIVCFTLTAKMNVT